MLSKEKIREAIVSELNRLPQNGAASFNEVALAHADGTFRGLLWALTGNDPGHYVTRDVARICRMAGIKHETLDSLVHYG